jgi:ABC-2 type transport system ATP-binding protein
VLEVDGLAPAAAGAGSGEARELRFALARGALVLLGPHGTGKSAVLAVLSGMAPAGAAHLRLDGADLATDPGRLRAQAAYVPQPLHLPADLTLAEYLATCAVLDGATGRDVAAAAGRAAARVHLEAALPRRLSRLSGGMQRRALVAQALMRRARLLVVDEPTAGLDPWERLHVLALLRERAREGPVVAASARLADAAALGADVAVLTSDGPAYLGSLEGLSRLAAGRVWLLESADDARRGPVRPQPGPDGLRWRWVGGAPPSGAQAAEPTPEDGYLWVVSQAAAA